MFKDEDFGFNKIKEELEKLGNMKVIVEIDPDKVYSTGEKVEKVAVWMEYGADEFNVNYPARPFFRVGFDANIENLKKLYEKRVDLIIAGNGTAEALGHELGKYMVQKIKEVIENGEFAELAESTIKRKGSDKPLVDTKALLTSIRYRIEW